MCLCAEYFLFAAVPVVQGGRPAAGRGLCAEITKSRDEIKRCAVCGAAFTPNSNRLNTARIAPVQVRRKKEAERQRKRYLLSTHLGR